MGREERNIRPGGAAEPTRDKILLRPCRGGSLLGGRSFTGGCARLRLASHRLLSVAPSGAGEHHDRDRVSRIGYTIPCALSVPVITPSPTCRSNTSVPSVLSIVKCG